MAGIGEQSDRSRCNTINDFGDDETEVERSADSECPTKTRRGMAVPVTAMRGMAVSAGMVGLAVFPVFRVFWCMVGSNLRHMRSWLARHN